MCCSAGLPSTLYVSLRPGFIRRYEWLKPTSGFGGTEGSETPRNSRLKYRQYRTPKSDAIHSSVIRPLDSRLVLFGTSTGQLLLFPTVGPSSMKKPLSSPTVSTSPIHTLVFNTIDTVCVGTESGEVLGINLLRARGHSHGSSASSASILNFSKMGDRVRAGVRFSENILCVGDYSSRGCCRIYDWRVGEGRGRSGRRGRRRSSAGVVEWWADGPVEALCQWGGGVGHAGYCVIGAVRSGIRVWDVRYVGRNEGPGACKSIGGAASLHAKTISDMLVYEDEETSKVYLTTTSLDASCAVSRLFPLNSTAGSELRAPKTVKRFRFAGTDPLLFGRIVRGSSSESIMEKLAPYDRLCVATLRSGIMVCESRKSRTLRVLRDERELVAENCRNLVNLSLLKSVVRMKRQVKVNHDTLLGEFAADIAKFRYKEVLLNAIIQKGVSDPIVVVSIIEELRSRNELINAIDARSPDQICIILRFVHRFIADERFSVSVGSLFGLILHYYGGVVGRADEVDRWLRRIHRRIDAQVGVFMEMQKLRGLIDVLMINALK